MRFGLVTVAVLMQFTSFGQNSIGWQAPHRVADQTYGNLHPRIKLDRNNNPMVVWGDDAGKIYFTKWGGEGFANPTPLNPPGNYAFTSSWSGPDIASQGDTVYIVWKQIPEDKSRIYIKHSFDGGKKFSASAEVDTAGEYTTRFPTVTTDETGNPFVTYQKTPKDYSGSMYVVARSQDMGETFFRDTPASVNSGGNVCECSPASIVASGNAGILLYRNNSNGLRNIWAGISINGSKSFHTSLRLDSTDYAPANCPASSPSGVIVGDTLYSTFMSSVLEHGTVYLSRMSLSHPTISTAPLTGEITGVTTQNFPRMAGNGYACAVVWTQTAGGNNQVCMAFTPDVTYGFMRGIDTVAEGVMINADVAIGGGNIFIVWEDQVNRCVMFRKGVYYKKSGVVENTSIIIDPPSKGQKYFTIKMKGILSCTLTDVKGSEVEADISYPSNKEICKVSLEDFDPGKYSVKVFDEQGRIYNAQLLVE